MTGAARPPGPQQWLDPAVLARLGSLELKARVIVEGFLQGLHRSPFKGFSVEFAEYRPYLPGDDPASIDWRAFARTDRYYVKRFEQETNLPCHLLLDVSASMGYGSGPLTKLQYGSYLAASLAYLLSRQRDAVGLMAFDHDVVTHLPPSTRPRHLRSLLVALDALRPGTRSDLARPLNRLAAALARRGLVVVISDLLDDPDRVVEGLRHVRFRGMEVIVFQVLDHAELTFPFAGATRFRDVESGAEVVTQPAEAREEYLRRMTALTEHYARALPAAGVDYCLLDTAQPMHVGLLAYLAARRRVM
jgi:uncharacterized protein (DUF58 family)